VADPELVSADGSTLDQYCMDSRGRAQAVLALLCSPSGATMERSAARQSTDASCMHPGRDAGVGENAEQLASVAAHDGVSYRRAQLRVDRYSHSMVAGGLLLTS
jgi:hypothetical protein